MHDASINLRTSLHMVREATSSQVWPSARFADGGNRGKDHVRDDLWLRDHDHVGALDLGDRRSGAPGHGTDDIATGRLVAGRHHGPGRQGFPGGYPGRLGKRQVGGGALGGGHHGGLLGGQVGGEDLVEARGVDCKLHRRLRAPPGRVVEREQGRAEDTRIGPADDLIGSVSHQDDAQQCAHRQQRKGEVDGPAVHLLKAFQAEQAQPLAGQHLRLEAMRLHQVHDAGQKGDADADRRQHQEDAMNDTPVEQPGTFRRADSVSRIFSR